MKTILARGVAFLLVFAFLSTPVWATCGGGGGGGGGGMSGGGNNSGGANPTVYHVPWKMPDPKKPVATAGLVLYWFPASANEIKNSSLLESRDLSLYASQCVTMQLADGTLPNADKLIGDSKLPVAVLATPEGTTVSKIENTDGKLKVTDVEKLVGSEVKTRKTNVETNLKDAKAKAAAGEKETAIKEFQAVMADRCMFPGQAKDAAKELKKLGIENVGEIQTSPNFDPKITTAIIKVMKRGLIAENAAKYVEADKLYTEAHNIDPADPTPLRYLGELYRHHIGDWEKAKVEFHMILDMPADPLSRAVALHGLGKITIHEGEFLKGMHLMEDSVAEYPLALAYRNLAVYWNSEGDLTKGTYYTEKALAMAPSDPYNLVFAAVFMAANGKKDEALKIAMANMNLLPASYNLAAIFAQNGQKDKALELLKRHFYQYERYQDVRAKEMMEARVDAVFDSLRADKDFLALTKDADGRLPMPMSPKQKQMTDTMKMNP
ncbi:MAG: tetratricopeptide repeat protein [Acidobacteriota bacterium]